MGEGVRSASNLHSHMAQCAALGQHHILACSAVLCKMLLLMAHSRCDCHGTIQTRYVSALSQHSPHSR